MTPVVDIDPYDERSGLHIARAARDAGAVVDGPQEPLHDVSVAFTVHGSADLARGIVRELCEHVALLSCVPQPVSTSIITREATT